FPLTRRCPSLTTGTSALVPPARRSPVAKRWLPLPFLLALVPLLFADGPGDNVPDNVRPVPPPGAPITARDRQDLQAGVEALGKEIDDLKKTLKGKPHLELLPDVQVYYNAVRYALTYDEFYNPQRWYRGGHDVRSVAVARKHLETGMERARALREGK